MTDPADISPSSLPPGWMCAGANTYIHPRTMVRVCWTEATEQYPEPWAVTIPEPRGQTHHAIAEPLDWMWRWADAYGVG